MTTYDNTTREGRAKIDAAVLRAMGKRPTKRATVAEKLGLDPRAATKSLQRLTAAGKVNVYGERGLTEYSRA